MNPPPTTQQKALAINLDARKYGTLAEIGAGQEVARWLFRVGGAAGTVAKAVSAYDMAVSDSFYGPTSRYVSRARLEQMLDQEFEQVVGILGVARGERTEFFAFADTVAARNFAGTNECHGWLGVRFQNEPCGEPSQVVIHVRMLDREAVAQQEALGVLGINLLYAACFEYPDPESRLRSLLDGLTADRLEIDVIDLTGPRFRGEDMRVLALDLVKAGLSDAALFGPNGRPLQPSEVLRKRPILVERGSFRPVTNTNVDMLHTARRRFAADLGVAEDAVATVMELTLHNLLAEGSVDLSDFLSRADTLCASGATAMVSDYFEYYRLAAFLARLTDRPVALALGVPSLSDIFNEGYYKNLEGGILEAFGRLFKGDLRIYVYPLLLPNGELETAETWTPPAKLAHLYQYLLDGKKVVAIEGYDPACLPIFSRDVLAKIRAGDPAWASMVPPSVAAIVRERGLFGYDAAGRP